LKDPHAILVIATRQIGDVLLTAPLIEAAKERWPQVSIDVLGFAGTLGMLKGNTAIRDFVEVAPGSGWRQAWPLVRRLWRRYDLALITQQSDRAHLYGWLAASVRSGLVPSRTSISWWKRRLLQHAVRVDDETTPTVIEKLKLLDPWRELPGEIRIAPPPDAALPAELDGSLGPTPIVVHVPSMWRYKQWPISHYTELLRELLTRGHQVVLTGSGSATDQAQIAQVRGLAQAPQLIDASGSLNLNQVGALLRRSALYVGPDTSITHLAAACGVPVVALFGPTNPIRWGPWPQGHDAGPAYVRAQPQQSSRRVILLQADQACIACGRAGCEDHHDSRSLCLEALPPGRVLQACLSVLPVSPGASRFGA
jgi:heptosyltransferase III